MSSSSISRRMAVLFAVALALILWRATRIEPPRRPAYQTVVREGEQLFPIGVSVLAERFVLGHPSAHLERLRGTSVRRHDAKPVGLDCELFVRVARNHWRLHVVSLAELDRLDVRRPFDRDVGRYAIAPSDAIDDDDGDGRTLDPGELVGPEGPGAEVELHCPRDAAGGNP
ncbi:MAG: hypothetical protein AAGE94_14105 [Acidobacteriota bacterium]